MIYCRFISKKKGNIMKSHIRLISLVIATILLCLLGGCQNGETNASSIPPDINVSLPNEETYKPTDGTNSSDQPISIPHTHTIIAGKNSITMLDGNGDVWEYRGTIDETGRLAVEKITTGRNIQTLYINDTPGNFTYCIAVDCNGDAFDILTGENESTTEYFNSTDSLVADYSATYDHAMILLDDGSLWAYGENYEGAINGESVSNYLYEPEKVTDGIQSVATAGHHTLVIKDDGTLWGWGDDRYGQLAGCGNLKCFTRPVQIMENVKYAFASERDSFAITTDGVLWGWGENDSGLVDFRTFKSRYTPIKIMDDAKKIVTDLDYPGCDCAFVVKTDGTLWAYGVGYLGDGEKASDFKPPRKIMDSVVDVAIYDGLSVALKDDGTVWWWGIAGDSFNQAESLSPTKLFENIQLPK